MPWPDAASFYVPWHDLFQWPPAWKASCVAAFVPSAAHANFAMMPALTLVLGSLSSLGLMKIMDPTLTLK
jgi:hypothetical protein